MELTINKIEFKKFLDVISLSGENQIKEALINVKKDSISALVKSPTNAVGVRAILKGDFNEIGEIGIDDLVLLKNALNLQDKDNITLKIKDNKLNIASIKTKVTLILRNAEFIKNKPKEDDFNKYISNASGNEFKLNDEDIEKLTKAYNLIKSETINIYADSNKIVKFNYTKNDNEVETEIDIDNKIENFKTSVSASFLTLISPLDECNISVKKDSSVIYLSYIKNNIKVHYIIATLGKK